MTKKKRNRQLTAKVLVERNTVLEKQLGDCQHARDKLQAVVDAMLAADAKPYTLLKYIGSPFGDWDQKEFRDGYWQLNQTIVTNERFVWHVAAMDFSDPKQHKVTLKFVARENTMV